MSENTIIVNGEEREIPESRLLDDVVQLYGNILKGESYFVKLNGVTINSILHDADVYVKPGDRLEVFPLVIGG